MNETQHLTTAELDSLLIGDRNDSATLHLEACLPCAAEVRTMRSSLALLSGAMTNMAHQQSLGGATRNTLLTPRSAVKRPVFQLAATLALAASVAIVAVVLPTGHTKPQPVAQPAVATVTSSSQSDEALLSEIDQQLSASVPEALAPLQDPTGAQPTK